MTLTAGSRLGPYEIVAPLGAGGMGEVYKAKDTRLGREVAVKVLPASFSSDADRLRRFEQEARAASALNHPNILTIHDVGEHDGTPYVVTELLEGETLRGRMAGGALAPKRALGHALQIAHGLEAAHERGIVHRDLKPENIFVTKDGRTKILDFGLAKLVEAPVVANQTDVPTATPSTNPGTVLGTLGYMSPEQVRGKAADPRSDIFSFGAILYEMLSGRRAFQGDTSADTMSAILTKEPPELSATNRSVSPGLDRVVRHCLEKDPDRRFHSAHDLAFDLEALSDASGTAATAAASVQSWKRIALPLAAAAILAAGAFLWLRRGTAGGAALDSIAVLPFVNATRDPETEYLSDGITETIINTLSSLPNLRVAPRSSVFRFKGKEDDPQKIGRDLNVRAVVSGKVIQRGDRLTVQAELVDIGKGSQIWGEQYDRPMSEILAIQEQIAKDISEKLQVRMTGEQREKLGKGGTQNTEAFQLYLKGRYAWEKRTAENLRQSNEYFQKAIELDPSFALAYTGLASTYAVLSSYSIMSPTESHSRAKAAARKALEIDESLAPAHAALALALSEGDRDWPAAEAEFRKAIELDASYATAYLWYALHLSKLGRHDEAIREIQTAKELDPFSQIIQANSARVLIWAGRFSEGLEVARKVASEFPNFGPPHLFAATAYEGIGKPQEAAAEFRKAAAVTVPPQEPWFRGQAAALEGRVPEVRAAIADLEALSSRQYVSPAYIAILHIRLGEKDKAFAWLELAVVDHSYDLGYITVDPMFAGIRGDPRYDELAFRLRRPGKL